jgi:signal transduction histidine kinase
VEFSSEKNFQEILNTEINKARTEQGPQANHFEIDGGHSAFLQFSNQEQYYFFGKVPLASGIEYAIGKPENWQRLGGREDIKFSQGYSYIYLDKPEPGKAVKIFLRYKHQPESVHEVTVDVKPLPRHAGWIDVALVISGVIVLALLAIFIQKQRYKKQLTKVNRKKSEIENQLQLLSGQLNPHFLFNSLNAVQSLIRQNDPEAANQYITEVATFMRTIMDNGRKELVSLAEEIDIEEQYIALEQKRKAFTYTFRNECGNDIASIDFPPLLLQPVIENSIRHGLAETVRNPTLTVTIRCDATDLIVVIADNGTGFDTSVKVPGHGLSLTGKRIALINEKLPAMQIILQTKSTPGSGTITEIRLLKWLS